MANLPLSHRNRPRVLYSVNDNYCVNYVTVLKDFACVPGKECLNPSVVMARSRDLINKSKTVNLPVNACVANLYFVTGLPQKKDVNPNYCHNYTERKYVKDITCVGHVSSANYVTSEPTVAVDPPVGARLHQFWEKWEALGSSPKVVTALREGYTLPFRFISNLTRSPTVISKYVNPQKQSHLLEALYQLVNKNAVEPVANQKSLGFYNRLFLVPKPNNRWRPILHLSTLNTFLNTESFKMETPETIRPSLQAGEWVTSIDFKDAYFHIPIHSQSRKYMRCYIQGPSYQFKALPFGLSTAPMEFTVVKEVKLMTLQRGVRNHQYPPNLAPAYTNLGSSLLRTRLAGEQGKVRTGSKTGFPLCRLLVRLERGQSQTHTRALADLIDKIHNILSSPVCLVQQFTSLIGLLTATEKQVHLT